MKYTCSKCGNPTDGLLWYGPYWYCWEHFLNATATERVRVGSLSYPEPARERSMLSDADVEEVRERVRIRRGNDVY